jgi:menaquinone-dependent protoporphyrinogen oxidase
VKPFLVLFATREGHSRKVAEYVTRRLQSKGVAAELVGAAKVPKGLQLRDYYFAIAIASVHRQKHEPEMATFLKTHASELARIPSAFVSISLSQAGAENSSAAAPQREKAATDAQKMIDVFLNEIGWRPSKTKAVAGALAYSKYNFLIRFIMKRIAAHEGGDTDTSKDYEYTDWEGLGQFVDDLISNQRAS